MFRVQPNEIGRTYRLGVILLLALSVVSLLVTVWVEIDFLREQELVKELIKSLPNEGRSPAYELAGELRWQFRLTTLVVLNLVVTGFAVVLLWRAYRSSQESLRDVKALAGDILSSMEQAVVTTDAAGVVTSINRRGEILLGTDWNAVGSPLGNFSPVLPLEEFREDWLVEKSSAVIRDFRIVEDGNERIVRAFCQSLTNADGEETGNVLEIRDVTERLLIDERIRRMERYMGLGSLAAGLHHEIKNPLAAVTLHLQLLDEELDGCPVSDEAREMLDIINTELARIGGVLESFRDFAAVDRLWLADVNMRELIEQQTRLIAPQAAASRVQISVDSSVRTLPTISGDRTRLEQVLHNLFVNAIEAMKTGGQLRVSAVVAPASNRLVVTVADTGGGIPDDLKERVFDPYFSTKNGGTGLGLSLCDKIMRQHQGSLDFSSSPAGSEFRMTLPLQQSDEEDTSNRS
ncbi:PAS domain S-box protein [bacterium]|nr:PAS domain S-box protein [bacterium]